MSLNPTSPFTGASQNGLTSPTYTISEGFAPNNHSRQWTVTALGGTQSGVDAHSVSKPFTITVELPTQFKQLGMPNPTTGLVSNVPMNVYTIRVRKGAVPLSGQPDKVARFEAKAYIPAGSDEADPTTLKALCSAFIGFLNDNSDEIGDSWLTGAI